RSLQGYASPRSLPSFPTRRSSDLRAPGGSVRDLRAAAHALHLGRGDPLPLSLAALAAVSDSTRAQQDMLNPAGPQAQHISDFFLDRKSTRLNSSHQIISYAVFCLK